jgi:hypothetical protein
VSREGRDDPASVYSAILSADQLNDLFDDIAACGRYVLVRLKCQGDGLADESRATLTQAKTALVAGASAQVRYEHQGVPWSDTLRPTAEGVRLIRSRLPEI